MKKIILVFLLMFCGFVRNVRAEPAAFVSGFEDLPLMAGLAEHEETGVSFDTPGGRIIEAYAESSRLTAKEIFGFYAKTLPQLGWKSKKNGAKSETRAEYARDGEILNISVENGAPVIVRFELMTGDN